MELLLSGPELERFKRYAESLGMTLEQAVTHAVRSETNRRYRLPTRSGRVVNFEGLKRPAIGEKE